MKSFTFPKHIKKIGKEALAGCNSLEKIVIPKEVTSIKAFDQDCPNLKTIVNRSKIDYSLKASKLVKTWYQGEVEVNKAEAGKTVTCQNKTFKITYKTTTANGAKVQINGSLPDTYQYGETIKMPTDYTIEDGEDKQYVMLGWRYKCKDKKYRTGQVRTYQDAYREESAVGTKGDIVIQPSIMTVSAKKEKKNRIALRIDSESV